MLLGDVIGQENLKKELLGLNNSGKIPHALLFTGVPGSGNLALAMAFAQLVQCLAPTKAGACNTCNACQKASKMVHPDIHFSYPVVSKKGGDKPVSTDYSKEWRTKVLDNAYIDINEWLQYIEAENKQGNITAEECNAIMRKLSLTKFEGKYKILLMWLPEYLGEQGNKLLKMIEEPPEDTLFFLCTNNTELILNTILSRCQLLRLDPLSDTQVSQALVEKKLLEPNHARHIAFMAEGNFIEALQLIGNQHNNDSELLLNWLRKCWIGNPAEIMEWVDRDFSKLGRENQKQFLRFSLHFLRELLLKVVTGTENLRLEPKEAQVAANMAKLLNYEKISLITQLLNDNYYYIERNANPKILFLDASIKVHKIMRA